MSNSPILFGHRGARGHAQENTLASFELALRLGASGVETDAWITRDGSVVLDHDGEFGSRLRRRSIADVNVDQLPSHIPLLADACALLHDHHLSIDVKDVDAFTPLCAVIEQSGLDPSKVWLCHPDYDTVAAWRTSTTCRLVHSTRYAKVQPHFETHASRLARDGIDAFNMPCNEWTGGLIALYHRFGVRCFAWNVNYTEIASPLVASGIDALYGDFVDRLVDAVNG